MGIQNLLKFLKPFIEPVHIREYSGKRVGIDAYSWLHKGAYSCSMELCLNLPGDAARRYIKYFMHYINLLRHYKIVPVVVFDGASIPCKSATEHERHRRRQASLEMAKEKLNQGNLAAANEFFRRAVCVTPSMAYNLIRILKSESVEFIVAPYEADAQLAYLSTLSPDQGGIAAVITEDSDLIAYRCPAIVFKMDCYGNGEEFVMDRVFQFDSDGISFNDFNKEMLTGMCILAGCDFLPNIPGIGIKRAYSLVSKYKSLDRVLSVLKFDKRYKTPENYAESFRKTAAVFHHARVYDLVTQTLTHLSPLEEKHLEILNGDLDLLGPISVKYGTSRIRFIISSTLFKNSCLLVSLIGGTFLHIQNRLRDLSPSIAAAIAKGHMDPITMRAFDCLPQAEVCSKSGSRPAFDFLKTDSRKKFTEESCFNIFTAKEASKDTEDSEESCLIFKDMQPCNQNADQMSLDQKYIREASVLEKLISPVRCPQAREVEVGTRLVPNNNPFKRRKIEKSCSEKNQKLTEQTVSEKSLGTICSVAGSQESVDSKPTKLIPIEEDNILQRHKTQNKGLKIEKVGILKFFKRS